MNRRVKHKIFKNMYNPKMNYSVRQILIATKGLFLTPIKINDNRYCISHYCGKIIKIK